ncbi:hypothetical protein [Thiorhodovibrio winogradskyi]|uniref:hypothetical protein n=1 Tax=Thiorhodovibrio winogradskyi TaxID=77007 RepID=UPI002E2813E9|nr:hypothetical protein [Thiorhodovibrio winogradskyi]
MTGLAILVWGLMKRDRMIQFPFLAAVVFLGWVMPQLVGLTNRSDLPAGALEKTIFMAFLCLIAAWLGYVHNRRPARLFWWILDRKRLLIGSAVLSLLGAFFFFKVSQLAPEVTAATGNQWTGIITIYVFFAKLLSIGMVIALLLYLIKPSWAPLCVFLFDLAFYLDRIIVKGRRATMIELAMLLLMALWFQRRWLPPRWAMISGLLLGALVVNSIGDYRNTMMGDDRATWSGAGVNEVLEIDFVGNFMERASGDANNFELTNAVMNIEAADRRLRFDFGLSLWNDLVHSYVPGQWVGYGLKKGLMLDFGNAAYAEFRHVPHTGSTLTGLSDSFLSFWYFGAIKFFLIGFIMSLWYKAAMQGNYVAQIIVILLTTQALQAITHSTHEFFSVFFQFAVFLLPTIYLARRNLSTKPMSIF